MFSEIQTCSRTKLLDSVGQKTIGTRNDIVFLCVHFFDTRFFSETQKASPTKFIGTMRQNFEIKIVTNPYSLIKKNCETRKFLKHRSVSARNFLALWNKKISTDNSEVPLLSVSFFDTRFFSETQKSCVTKFFGNVGHRLWQKIVIHTPLLLSIKLFDTQCFLKYIRVPLRNFWTLWDKKLLAQENDMPFLCVHFFDTRFFSETQKCCPTNFFGTVRQTLEKNCDKPPLLLSIKISDTRSFLKHGRGPLRIFSALWDKIFSIEIIDMPLLCIGFSDTRFFLKHRGVPLRNFSVLWEKKLLTENIKVSLLSVIFFDNRFFSETQKVSPTMFFDTVRKQLFDGKLWCPLFFILEIVRC